MLNEDEIMEHLQSFGLTKYESEIYFLLLKYRNLTASKLGKLSKVPITRIYDIAQSLIEKGLIGLVNPAPKEYCALPFEGALEILIAKKNDVFQKDIALLELKKKTLLRTVSSMPEREMIDTTAFCFTLNGKKAAVHACHSLFLNAKKEVLIFSGDSSWVNAELPRIKGMLNKGIGLRMLANTKYPENLNGAKKTGVAVRLSDNLLRGIIADRKYLYLLKKHVDFKALEKPLHKSDESESSPDIKRNENGTDTGGNENCQNGGKYKENSGAAAKNCWEFWNCNKTIMESCSAYIMGLGHECWMIAGTSGDKKCPKLKNGFKSCIACPWFGKMNSLEEDYSCIITEDKNIIESLRDYFLIKWNAGQKL